VAAQAIADGYQVIALSFRYGQRHQRELEAAKQLVRHFINALDYSGYPDCRPEYLETYQQLANLSSKAGLAGQAPRLVAPLILDSKRDIVQRALALGVPIAETWSCYQGGDVPCGLCDACRLRDRALIEAGHGELATPIAQLSIKT